MNYTKREVVRRLKQYDMFLNSLNLTTDSVLRERICDQLDKIEKQILLETNAEYEEEYMLLLGENTKSFDEEKNRLRNIISLILDRRQYLEERKAKHKKVTGSLVELTTFLGEDKLSDFRKNLKIIEKYEENKARQEILIKDIKALDIKISEASRNVKANMRLNDSLEHKMISLAEDSLKKLNLYSLTDKKDEIKQKFNSLEYALNLAKDNLKTAKEMGNSEAILECDNMLSEMTIEYSKYNEDVNILKLIDIFDREVIGYEDLLAKREEIDVILKNISGSDLYLEINDELSKQYNTIKLERQDIDIYEDLKLEREKKNKTLYQIEEENNSKEFKVVLEELIRTEKKIREEKIQKARKAEYLERQKKLVEEQKIESARVKRQKLIEEARLKDQLARTEKLKELQNKTVITSKKEETKPKEEIQEVVKEKESIQDKILRDTLMTGNDFDTNELFENTKIVPNRKKEVESPKEMSLEVTTESPVEEIKLPEIGIKEENRVVEDTPIVEDTTPDIIDLFKENQTKIRNVEVPDEDAPTSIYDILENNQNIMWKSTGTDSQSDTRKVPVIGNNNLKPKIIDEKQVSSTDFPELGSKEGEILWKETI